MNQCSIEDRLNEYRRRKERRQEYKDLAARGCYSMILVMVALILLRPLMVSHILSRADAYSAVGRLDESGRQCDKALLIDGDSSDAWYGLAEVHKARGDRELACGAYQKATEADSRNAPAHFKLAMMYVDDGRYQLAIPYFEQVRKLGPDKPEPGVPTTSYHRTALDMLALCYEKEGDPVKMELTLKEIRIFYPGYSRAQDRATQPQ